MSPYSNSQNQRTFTDLSIATLQLLPLWDYMERFSNTHLSAQLQAYLEPFSQIFLLRLKPHV